MNSVKQTLKRLHSGEAHMDDHGRHKSGQGGIREAELGSCGALLRQVLFEMPGHEGVLYDSFVKGRGVCECSVIISEHTERLLEDCQSKLGEKFTEAPCGERDLPTIILALQETSMVSSGMMSDSIFSWDKASFLILGLL